ncbi:MAG: hypothetical protein WCL53_06500 [Chloroflexota bacterium]
MAVAVDAAAGVDVTAIAGAPPHAVTIKATTSANAGSRGCNAILSG